MIFVLFEFKMVSLCFDEEGDCWLEVKSYMFNCFCVEIMYMMNELIWKLFNLK